VPTKQERMELFVARLASKPPAMNGQQGLELLTTVLNQVEDELTNIPYNPDNWMNDGRMYPPQLDSVRLSSKPGVVRFRSRGHNTFIGLNGAIQIQKIDDASILIDKPGADGKKVSEL
jgi:hypothetical protein